MAKGWFSYTKRARSTQISNAKQLHREASFIERFDALSIAITIAVILIVTTFGWLVALATDRWGWFDPPVIRPIPDSRILTNIRPASSEYVDAVSLNRNSGEVLIGRRDGEVINYNRDTGLIEHENIKSDGGLEGELGILSSGCGWTDNYNQTDCPHGDIAFANTVSGGVALRNSTGDWSTIISDSTWRGLDGKLVQHEDVTHMAASDDGKLVFVLAGEKGAAVFDQEDKKWRVLEDIQKLLDASKLGGIKVVPIGRELFIGSKNGLGNIRISNQNPILRWSNDESNEILDISKDRKDNIWAVVEGRCQEPTPIKCLWIGHVKSVDRIDYVIGEQEPHPNLFAIDLQHASVQSEKVVTVGGAGVHSYDQKLRSWRTIVEGAIDSFIHIDNGETLFAAQADKLFKITDARITETTAIDGGPFTQLTANDSMILGLSRSGLIHDLGRNKTIAWRDAKIPEDTVFRTGASNGSTVLMLGKKGALVHHLTERRFSWIRSEQLPNSIRSQNIRLIQFSGDFWSVNSEIGEFRRLSLSGNHPSVKISADEQYSMPGPITSVSPTKDFVFAVGNDKVPYKLDSNGNITSQIGSPLPEKLNFKSIAANSNGLYFTDGQEIWHYDTTKRGWNFVADSPTGETIANIEANNEIHILTKSGRVYLLQQSSNDWHLIFGGGLNALFSSNSLSDAKYSDDSLYLAGEGSVQQYDLRSSGFVRNWQLGSKSRPRIIAINNNTPVWFIDSKVLFGENEILDRKVLNAWEVDGGFIALSNSNSRTPYLIHFQLYGNQQCTFYGAVPPTGKVIDAIPLPSRDRILVMATDGSAIYIPSEHRWITVSGLPTQENARLFISNSHLIVSTPNRLRALKLADIPSLHSCESPKSSIAFSVDIEGKFISVSEETSKAIILNDDGEINVWDDGTVSNILPSHEGHPETNKFVRVVKIPNGFLFATHNRLWSYNLEKRTWRSFPIYLPNNSGKITSIDMIGGSFNVPINIWTDKGSFHGVWRGQSNVSLTGFKLEKGLKFETKANQILNVSQNRNRVAVSSEFAIEMIDDSNRNENYRIELPPEENLVPAIRYFSQRDKFHVITNEAENLFYILPTPFPSGGKSVKLNKIAYRYALNSDLSWGIDIKSSTLWRIASNGELYSCKIEKGYTSNNCVLKIREPFEVDKPDIRFAYLFNNNQFLLTNSGWFRLTSQLRNPEFVDAPRISSQDDVKYWQKALLVFPKDRSLHIIPNNANKSRELTKNLLFARTDETRLFIAYKGGIKIYNYGNGIPQKTLRHNRFRAAGINWLDENTILTGINSKGFPVYQSTGRKIGPRLFHPQSIKSLVLESSGNHLWIQRESGQVELIEKSTCDISHHRTMKSCFKTIEIIDKKAIQTVGRLYGAERNKLLFENGQLNRTKNLGWIRRNASFSEFSKLNDSNLNTDQIVSKVVEQGGRMVLAPVRIEANSVLDTMNSEIATVHSKTEPWEELNISDQLSWNRIARKFELPSVDGSKIQLSAVDALVEGVPLPYLHGRQISPQSELYPYYHLNSKGLWKVGYDYIYNVSLEDYANPVGLANGTFMFHDDKILNLNGTYHIGPRPQKFKIGEFELIDYPRTMKVSSELKYPTGETENNFTSRGFKHDIREAVGWLKDSPVILGPLRIIPADSMTGFDYVVGTSVEAVSDFNGDELAKVNGVWLQRTTGFNWVPANDPRKNVLVGQIDDISWELNSNSLNVSSNNYGDWRLNRNGLAFDVDTIFSAAGTPDEIVIVSKVGTHSVPKPTDLGRLSNPKTDFAPKLVEAIETSPRKHIIYAPKDRKIWKSGNWVDIQGNNRPWDKRLAVDSQNYKITFEIGKSQEILRRVSLIDGSDFWKPMSWKSRERFPTDQAQSLFVGPNETSIGTKFGLKSHLTATSTLSDIIVFDSNRRASAIEQIGKPDYNPSSVFALDSNGSCAEIKSSSFGKCLNSVNLNRRRVFESYLWNWVELDNKVEGFYKLQNAPIQTASLTSDGRWRHDNLISHVDCGNASYELWRNGKILHRISKSLELLKNDTFTKFHCQTMSQPLDNNSKVRVGTFMIGHDSTAQVNYNTNQVNSILSDEIGKRHNGEIFHHDNSFLVERGTRDLTYSMYWPDSKWRKMGWIEGLPAIDKSMAVQLGKSNDITRITPIGLLDHLPTNDGLNLVSNPIQIRSTSGIEEIGGCNVERIERLDGIVHTTIRQSDEALQWRCSNGKTMRDSPSTHGGLGNVMLLDQDPFSTRVVVEQRNFWHWTKNDSTVGSKPFHEISYKDEQLGLSGGRFELDQFKSIASPFKEIEIIGANGWWQQEPEDLSLKGAKRTDVLPNPSEVESVSSDTAPVFDGHLLCMETDGNVLVLDNEGTLNNSEQCGYWTGNDPHWTYRNLPELLSTAAGKAVNNKQITRQIKNGRFADLTAVSSPIPIENLSNMEIAVPTGIGVGIWDTDRNLIRQYGFNDMNAIIAGLDNDPIVLWGNTSVSLFNEKLQSCKSLLELGKMNVQKIELIGTNLYHVLGLGNRNDRIFLTVECDSNREELRAFREMEILSRTRYEAHISKTIDATGVLHFFAKNNTLTLTNGGKVNILAQEMKTGDILALVVRHHGREAVLVTNDEIYLVDIDAAISELSKLFGGI